MIPQIPYDITRVIIENCITQKIYPLLSVNKLWCEITIPLLWKNPCTNSSWKRISKTILSCCDSDLRQTLYEKGITKTPLNPPLFNYVSYIQILSKEIIEFLIEGIYEEGIHDESYQSHYGFLQVTFWNLFMNNCKKLKTLNLPKYSICNFNGAKTCLHSLVKLTCSTFIPCKYFLELSEICHNLHEIIIHCFQDNKGLAQLITSQKNLKKIELNSIQNHILCPLIGEALSNRSNTIISVNFQYDLCVFPHFPFVNCEELSIYIPSESTFDFNKLELINLPKLKILNSYIYQHQTLSIALDSLSNVIVSSSIASQNSSHLKKIDLDLYPKYLTTKSIKNFLHVIAQNCPLLEFVVVWVRKDVLSDLKSFLKKCEFLEELKFIAIESEENDNIVDAKNIFDILVNNNILPDLSKITFKESWRFTKEDLNEFLSSWKKSPLELRFENIITSSKIVTDVCNRFKRNGVIRNYAFD